MGCATSKPTVVEVGTKKNEDGPKSAAFGEEELDKVPPLKR